MTASKLPQELRRKLPSPHGVAIAILEASQSESTGIGDIAELVANDPALSGRLLQLANSAALGAAVGSIQQAVPRLGMEAVKIWPWASRLLTSTAAVAASTFPTKNSGASPF